MASQLRGLSLFLALLASVLSATGSSLAQSDSVPKRHAIVLEAAGIGGYWSVNHEFKLVVDKRMVWPYVSYGFSFLRMRNYQQDFDPTFLVPVSVGLLLGAGANKADLAISNTLISEVIASETLDIERRNQFNGAVHLGYRYGATDRNLFFKVYYAVVFVNYESAINWGGMGLGYTIK